jgi:regulator of sirC expression with transglutaminase-like and TPR domain
VVIDLDPENDLEYFNRGIAYHYLELHEEVVKDLTRAIDLDPTNESAKSLLEQSRARLRSKLADRFQYPLKPKKQSNR